MGSFSSGWITSKVLGAIGSVVGLLARLGGGAIGSVVGLLRQGFGGYRVSGWITKARFRGL